MIARSTHLDVFFEDEHVGSIYDTAPISFEYSSKWLARPEQVPVAAIPLASGRFASADVLAFFENLLPEGELRNYIAEQKKASTLFSLLLEVAGDTAGGFVILPAGKQPEAASYDRTTWVALRKTLTTSSAAAIDIKGAHARISLAGAQDKASIAISETGAPLLPRGTSPSTHILKPDIKRLAKVWHSAANEAIVMLTAAECEMPTAEVFYEPVTQSCIVRRFDRATRVDGSLSRLIQYDLCQLSGTLSDRKYEKEGGPGIADCAQIIRDQSSQPAVDLKHFITWLFFNLYTGNNDSHAKNLSMYRVAQRSMVLTPFYDLMCTRIYPGLSREFAFSIGGELKPGQVKREHVVAMSKQINARPSFVLEIAEATAKKIPDAISAAVEIVTKELPPSGKALARRVHNFVVSNTRRTRLRILKAN